MTKSEQLRRGVGGLAVATLVALTVPAGALAATPTRSPDFALRLSATAPGSPTGASLHIVYRDPHDPDAKPPPLRRLRIDAPEGMRFNGSSLPRCAADDQELMARGRDACPPASRIGGGTLTVITGFGPPADPFATQVAIYNTGDGFVELAQQPGTNQTLGIDRIHVSGSTLTTQPPHTPGGPPDGETAVRQIDFSFPASTGWARTPPACPATGAWTSVGTFTLGDAGTPYSYASASPCRAAVPPVRPRMLVGVLPRLLPTGRTRVLRVLVRSVRHCRGGVRVRAGGRSARTDNRGRADLRVRFTRTGRRRVTATKHGCRAAAASVSVVPR